MRSFFARFKVYILGVDKYHTFNTFDKHKLLFFPNFASTSTSAHSFVRSSHWSLFVSGRTDQGSDLAMERGPSGLLPQLPLQPPRPRSRAHRRLDGPLHRLWARGRGPQCHHRGGGRWGAPLLQRASREAPRRQWWAVLLPPALSSRRPGFGAGENSAGEVSFQSFFFLLPSDNPFTILAQKFLSAS